MPKLSIIIPCYNEAGNIPLLIKSINNVYIPDTEIILVDNGSTDDTADVLLKELELIEKGIDKGYSDVEINNSELSNMINNQNDIRINLNEKLTSYNYNSKSDKVNLFAEIKKLINNYINNYNSIREYIKNNAIIDAKKDTI